MYWNIDGQTSVVNQDITGHDATKVQILEFNRSGQNLSVRVNGVVGFSAQSNQNINLKEFRIDRIGMKWDSSTGVGVWDGNISEIVATTNTTEREEIEGYLAHKWGLEADLPNSHTYKNSAPSTGPVAPNQPSSVAAGAIPNQPASITTSIYVPPAVQTFKVATSPYPYEVGNTFTAVAVNPAYYNSGLTPSGGPHSYQSSSGAFLSRNINYFTATANGDRFWYGSVNNGGGNNSGYDQIDGTQQQNFGWSFSNFTY